ncbi:prepilin-type N-terminal cleavage/methylation domain-containing protein [Neobacillus niacini]|uniref:prepilin-type N-terminal cleavage/methylation domain-containing protein n=1 Tax=Neobacillus niacini TaxID=86668 RepID=UPI002FFFBC42
MHDERGLTLVEVLATLTILSIVSIIIWSIFFQGLNFSKKETSKNVMIQESNIIISNLTTVHRGENKYEITSTGTNNCEITVTTDISNTEKQTQTFTHSQMCFEFTTDIKNKKADDPEPNKIDPNKNDVSLTITVKDNNDSTNKVTTSTYLYRMKGVGY